MNDQIQPYELRVAWHNFQNQLSSVWANSVDIRALFDDMVADGLIVDELEQAFSRKTDLRLVPASSV